MEEDIRSGWRNGNWKKVRSSYPEWARNMRNSKRKKKKNVISYNPEAKLTYK
jgi:hypothetical protein